MNPAWPPALIAWEAGGRYRMLLSQRIFTREAGQGPVLVLLHGFPTASFDWSALWPALIARFHVLSLDFLGFGLSAKPPRHDYTIAGQADLVEALLADAGVREYALLAHDFGDTVAQELLARQREGSSRQKLRAACLLNGGLFPETHRPVLAQKALASPIGPLVARMMGRRRFVANMQAICLDHLRADDLEAMWQLLEHQQGRRVIPRIIRYMAERRRYRERWAGALIQAPVPLRLVIGMQDPIAGGHMLARYRELVPGADTVALDGIGHYPQIEAPEHILAAVLPLLERPRQSA